MTSTDDLRAHIADLRARADWRSPAAFGLGVATFSDGTTARRCSTPGTRSVNRDENPAFAALVRRGARIATAASGTHELTATVIDALADGRPTAHRRRSATIPNSAILPALRRFHDLPPAPTGVRRVPVVTFIESLDVPPVDTHDVYLRLHLLSTGKVAPHGSQPRRDLRPAEQRGVDHDGPVRPRRLRVVCAPTCAPAATTSTVSGLDKFPRMADYVIPVRRAHRRRRAGCGWARTSPRARRSCTRGS